MRISDRAGRYEIAQMNGEITALLGNTKLAIFAGLLMERFARVSLTMYGKRRCDFADNVKYINE